MEYNCKECRFFDRQGEVPQCVLTQECSRNIKDRYEPKEPTRPAVPEGIVREMPQMDCLLACRDRINALIDLIAYHDKELIELRKGVEGK